MASLTMDSKVSLLSGEQIPVLGFGVWDSPRDLTTKSCVEAIKVGYRHIDTGQVYGNEVEVGQALKKAEVPRNDIFVTTKILSPGSGGSTSTNAKLVESVINLVGDKGYIDLMLIHNVSSGATGIKAMWQAMEELHQQGTLKSIGVSNFGIAHIEQMKEYAKTWPPTVNQLELHPWCQQRDIVDYCHQNGIVVEAYCPLVRNQKANDSTLKSIAAKHGKLTPQILLRYCLQKNWVPLPKSDNPKRIAQNTDVFGFQLDSEDMEMLDGRPQEPALVVAVDNNSTK